MIQHGFVSPPTAMVNCSVNEVLRCGEIMPDEKKTDISLFLLSLFIFTIKSHLSNYFLFFPPPMNFYFYYFSSDEAQNSSLTKQYTGNGLRALKLMIVDLYMHPHINGKVSGETGS